MGNYYKNGVTYYKTINEYIIDINEVIDNIIYNNKKISFALVAQNANITPLVIKQYPELRSYILKKIDYYKNIKNINIKIDNAVERLCKSNKKLTFMAIVKSCRFPLDSIYKNKYIKGRILSVMLENIKKK
ncbi:hypothetical protein [Clostridium rectalis]|uniref:hypothetical protein n=1 Tax=Clostridium rectalis TaxID=2040295 RepID=UPI000F631817|nr:hypothetical protein [Clostridium rectalis]